MPSDSDVPTFNLKKIISESMREINDISDEAYVYFESLSKDKLITRLTRGSAKKIARELLSKMDIEVE